MKRSRIGVLLLAAPLALIPGTGSAAPVDGDGSDRLVSVRQAPDDRALSGSYIVTLKPGAEARTVAEQVSEEAAENGSGSARATARVKLKHVYTEALNGFSAKLDAAQLKELRGHESVAAIEEDAEVTVDATQYNAPWGLDRVDQRNRPLDGGYTYSRNGSGVTAYIIDTGIQTSHPDFGGRAQNVYDAFGGNGQDCQGHGTHVAGTVGGSTYGVAKGVALRGVRVLNCQGSGSISGIVAGFDWVRQNATKPAVANASLGGGYSSALNSAATNLANSGVHLAVAAGNENQNACNVSPASAPGTITVAASDSADRKASFSNYGSCTDLYAPGVSVTSARMGGGSTAMSGTSMASPHVSGVAALYKSSYGDASSSAVNNWIVSNATTNVISGNYSGTPNRLLFKSGM
ncbi:MULTISPECIES: S8 family peptidase [Streptomyces]|uniref:S8 family peptidase n=1 Tax=Streptomyces lycii TaxID=2654337 RepID=A0ABQ7FRQ5_9ACTN|nr:MULTISPECIES: S8 family peptidase [Streptomyces]KAF4410227.1 S8 family peptidase [Streptomyces lycii]PGH50480.1 serine protease [Streptomyces sp. Ru87]